MRPVFGKKLVCLIEHVLQPRLLAWGESTHNALPFPCVKPKSATNSGNSLG